MIMFVHFLVAKITNFYALAPFLEDIGDVEKKKENLHSSNRIDLCYLRDFAGKMPLLPQR